MLMRRDASIRTIEVEKGARRRRSPTMRESLVHAQRRGWEWRHE